MACTKWQETGLLYTSEELSDKQQRDYESHLGECSECRAELAAYRAEHEVWFTERMLGEEPSEDVSREILRVCSAAKTRTTGVGLFAGLLARPVLAAMLFLIVGLGSGAYIAYHVDNARNIAAQGATDAPILATDTASHSPDVAAFSSDSAESDSVADTTPFPDGGGTGIVPVDLQSK